MPSAAQLGLAERISADTGRPIPDDARGDAKALSAFIDQHGKPREAAPASAKQMEWVRKLVDGDGKPAPKGYPDKVTSKDAAAFLDKNFKKKAPKT